MPAKSKKQRKMMAIAEHHPEKLWKKNKGAAKMGKNALHDYAKTKEKGLPLKKGDKKESIKSFMTRRNKKKG